MGRVFVTSPARTVRYGHRDTYLQALALNAQRWTVSRMLTGIEVAPLAMVTRAIESQEG